MLPTRKTIWQARISAVSFNIEKTVMDIQNKILTIIASLVLLSVLITGCNVLESDLVSGLFPTLEPLPELLTLPTLAESNSLLYPTTTIDPVDEISTPMPAATNTPRPSLTPSPTIPSLIAYGPEVFPDNINPLTGLPLFNPEILDRRPIAMKIPLMPRGSARPQWGLTLADNVFEYYLEFGITRFVAIFYGNDASKAGPIRSGRLFDEQIMQMYNGILVFNSAFETIYDHFISNGFNNQLVVERTGGPLYRDPNVPVPSNLFASTSEISEYVTERGSDNSKFPQTGFFFRSYPIHGNATVDQVEVRFSESSYHRWEYSSIDRRYHRYQDAVDAFFIEDEKYEILVDQLTGEPVTADNVVVLYVDHNYFYKSSDTEIFDMDLTGSGEGYLFREGFMYPVTWERIATDQLLRIKTLDGKAAAFKFGETWFTILNTDSQLTVDGNFWRFEFVLPDEPVTETPTAEQ